MGKGLGDPQGREEVPLQRRGRGPSSLRSCRPSKQDQPPLVPGAPAAHHPPPHPGLPPFPARPTWPLTAVLFPLSFLCPLAPSSEEAQEEGKWGPGPQPPDRPPALCPPTSVTLRGPTPLTTCSVLLA